ncbi:E3 ubiquitin-protein ligase TRIM65 isoform X2 [Amia ocellicauda]|uniref:E3 ubiquitin-protein ligase TRIM65 isoform X2 n=1 Tax=Amia ocellicauda TaxID=2972642 RepID=UPI0034644BF3
MLLFPFCWSPPTVPTGPLLLCKAKVELNEKNKQLIKQINDTSRSIVELRDNIANTKVSLDQSSEWVKTKFTQLLKSMMEMQEAVQLSIDKERQSVVTEAEERLALLEERAEQLRNKQEQIETLQTLPDVNFLQETQVIQVPRMKKVPLNVSSDLQNKLHKVTGVLSNISKLVSEDLQKVVSVVGAQDRKDSPEDKQTPEYVVPNTTAPANPLSVKSHHAHYRNLLFDLNTANVNIKVSLGKRKAEHVTTGVQNYPPHEARFEHMWQVLCAEGLRDGQHYWEVEVSRYWAYLGVTYSSIPRKEKSKSSILGMNKVSWSLQLFERQLCAWHAGKKEVVTGKAQYKRIGMLLDWQAGTLTYYGDGHTRLHTFHCAFSQELYPAFFIGEEVSITLCPP